MQASCLTRRAIRWLGACMLLVTCAFALALPAPKDIEAAVNAGRYAQAETMLREVLQEKPGSARAHYELGQVLAHGAKYDEALTEIARAKAIDDSLKFASSPEQFQQTLDKIKAPASEAQRPASTLAAPIAAALAPAAEPASPALNMSYLLLGIGVLVLAAFLIYRSSRSTAHPAVSYPSPVPAPHAAGATHVAGATGFGTPYAPNGSGHAPGPSPWQTTGYGARAPGAGIGGAVLGGVAGLAAGYALSQALEGDNHGNSDSATASPATGGSGYVPMDALGQPDLGTFDGGAGAGWDGEDSGGSDDNW